MPKFRYAFLRSEYKIALNSYRKARRRGDIAEAQRWIKLADMHLRLADRFDDGVHKKRVREDAIERARSLAAREAANQNPVEEHRLTERQQIDEFMRQAYADIEARERGTPAAGS